VLQPDCYFQDCIKSIPLQVVREPTPVPSQYTTMTACELFMMPTATDYWWMRARYLPVWSIPLRIDKLYITELIK
jgi:hypothetical protein